MDCRSRFIQLIMKITFYVMLFILLILLIYPHTSLYFSTNAFSPFFMSLNQEDLVLVTGETYRLRVSGINKKATYVSSDFKVCDVSVGGTITAKRIGVAYIKVKVNKKVLRCRVHVININRKSIVIKVRKTFQLKVRGINSKVRWSSSNPFIATVNMRGKITGKRKGTVKIIGKVKGRTVSCTVVVY